MGRNVEIKARLGDLRLVASRAAALADDPPQVIVQRDTFFPSDHGRLKLRDFMDGSGELIFYQRADDEGPRESSYTKTSVTDPEGMRTLMAAALGTAGEVRKRRTLYLIGQTRVHLDEVEGLGAFVELEVVLEPEQSVDDGVPIARKLMEKLGVAGDGLVSRAYVDLLQEDAD